MRPIILYAATSLDNFIARPNGDVAWLDDPAYALPEGDDMGYSEFYEGIDITLMGNTTYQELLGFDVPFPYPDKTNYVFSRFKDHVDTEYVQFISSGVVPFVKNLKAQTGKGIWLIGGAQINGILLNHGLVDRIILTLVPIYLGKGIPLFTGQKNEEKFKLVKTQPFSNGMVQLTYDKVR